MFASSVIIQPPTDPIPPLVVTPSGSAFPSTQMDVLTVPSVRVMDPPSTSHTGGVVLFSSQLIVDAVAIQSAAVSPAPSKDKVSVAPKDGTKSPVVQIPAATATEDLM